MTDLSKLIQDLRPCPFCGGVASGDGRVRYGETMVKEDNLGQSEFYYCNCTRCGADNRGLRGFKTQPDAVAAWNRRTLDTHSSENERLRRINATLMGDDEDAPRYTTKRLRLEIQRATEAQAFRASELEALLHEARDTMLAPRAVYEPLVAKIDAALLGGTDGRATGEVRPVPETVGVDGWKLVPVEPTPEMLAAFWRQKNCGTQEPGRTGFVRSDYDAYAAMLAATPGQPT